MGAKRKKPVKRKVRKKKSDGGVLKFGEMTISAELGNAFGSLEAYFYGDGKTASEVPVMESVCPKCGRELVFDPIVSFDIYSGKQVVERANVYCPLVETTEAQAYSLFGGSSTVTVSINGHYFENKSVEVKNYLLPYLD